MKQPKLLLRRIRENDDHSLLARAPDGFAAILRLAGADLCVVVSWGLGWDHVSVHRRNGELCSWRHMCAVKAFFWHDQEWVVQYHPAEADYVNVHPSVLHLWKPQAENLPKPPKALV